ncbi:30S ribosomal protein S21, chloroplastic [Vigna umbellata]|uniref:30S ribosomal protein S21, chloroplastic n=1 Tax=Vigna umbellata TaxID=87088 RepID=UPI001F5E3BC6|nr:30S ribosomal protein S21, chloroplastic [Vigna umbellata]
MAASSTINNFLSFFLPTKPPPPSTPPPIQFNPTTSSPSQKPSQPLIAQYDPSSSSSSSTSSSSCSELSSVICPSMAYTNTLFFQSPYNVQVVVAQDEPEERLLNRFRREVLKAGVIQECRRRRYFENKQEEKKRKSREAAKRNRKRRPMSKTDAQKKQDVPATKREDEDNWDLPDGDTLY